MTGGIFMPNYQKNLAPPTGVIFMSEDVKLHGDTGAPTVRADST